jgi:spermidine synthase
MLFHRDPKAVMVLGLASGITAGEALCYPVDRLDILEINDQVVAASGFFDPWNNEVLSDPRTNLIIQDARAHLQLTGMSYDVIISEPSNPWMAGLAALFTRDFFSLARERLNEDGIFVQFIHSYQMDWETFALVGRTFVDVFPNSLLISTGIGERAGDYLLVGFRGDAGLNLDHADRRLAYAGSSGNVVISDARLMYRLVDSDDLRRLFGPGAVHTEDHPLLEFAAPRLMYRDDLRVPEYIEAGKRATLGAEIAAVAQRVESEADLRIDFAAYALSVFMPFRAMFDLSDYTPEQKERFIGLMTEYCDENEIDYSMIGDEELRKRCLSTQIETLENRKDLFSDNANSWFYLAGLYGMNGSASNAVRCYIEGLRIDPGSVKARNNLGNILLDQGRTDEAVSQYKAALRLDPLNADVLTNLGNALKKQGRTREAAALYADVLRMDPGNATAHFNLGTVLLEQRRFDEAIYHYSEGIRLNPENAEARNNLGIALYGKGMLNEAIVQFREAIRIRPDFMNAHSNLQRATAKKMEIDAVRRPSSH